MRRYWNRSTSVDLPSDIEAHIRAEGHDPIKVVRASWIQNASGDFNELQLVLAPTQAEADDHRKRLIKTIRKVARWRLEVSKRFPEDGFARKRSARAAAALRNLANFVASLSDEDIDLWALQHTPPSEEDYLIDPETWDLLSRFGMDRGAWQETRPTESQMRNILRRIEGSEAQRRYEERDDVDDA